MNRASVPVGRTVGILLAAAVTLAGCQPNTSALTPGPGTSGNPGSVEAPTSFGPPPSPTPPDVTSPVVLDPDLLAILPESIDGFAVTESPDEAALAISDPALPRIATSLDAAVAVDTGGGNLVYALVVKLRPDAFTDDTYRQWRDSFDEGACTAAGGIVGRAEAPIDERTVYITSCVAGMRTYHLWLKEQDTLISASSIGEGRFGEKLMDNLRVQP